MKFNSQICTTKGQSERLLALGLKKETADMVWSGLSKEPICHPYNRIKGLASDLDDKVHPAWSLHRLMEILDIWYFAISANKLDNPYDQVISYFEELVKGGFINKEYLEE